MPPQPDKKKSWERQDPILSPIQKIAIIVAVVGVILGVFVIWPLLARSHYVKDLKLHKEFFLAEPERIELKSLPVVIGSKHDVNKTYKVNLAGVEFSIPNEFTPVDIRPECVAFRSEPRRWAQEIYIKAEKSDMPMKFTKKGFTRWFMPTARLSFFKRMLYSTWHPIRLMFKARFYAAEGIAGPIYEASWGANHKGFICPTSGAYGYIARVFRTDRQGYFEFLYQDMVEPIALKEWVNLAVKIKPPQGNAQGRHQASGVRGTVIDLISKADDKRYEGNVLGDALSMFFAEGEPKWLIPVAKAMQKRGFYSELIELYHAYAKELGEQTHEKQIWNKMLKHSVEKILNLKIDTNINLHEIQVGCQNLTDLIINQIWVRVYVNFNNNEARNFELQLLDQGRLYPHQDKQLTIKTPLDISLSDSQSLKFEIEKIEFAQ